MNYNASELLLRNSGKGLEDKPALLFENTEIYYSQLIDEAKRIANIFRNRSIPEGSYIMVLMYDKPSFLTSFFAGLMTGCKMVLTNPNLSAEDYEYFLKDTQAKALIVDFPLYFKIKKIRQNCPELEHVFVLGSKAGENIDGVYNFETEIQKSSTDLSIADTREEDIAFVLYTSGTTGHPKGVVHQHKDLLYAYESYGKNVLQIKRNDIIFSLSKLFFSFGLGNAMVFPFSVGATSLLSPTWATATQVVELIEKYKPTILTALPSLYLSLLSVPNLKERNLSSLRLCISSGEKLSEYLRKKWKETCEQEIIDVLGSTEMFNSYLSRGEIVPGFEVKLINSENQEVRPGESGVMMVRGITSAPYYLNKPEKTAFTMREGWIYTGDIFHQDINGSYHFDGRSDDLLKVGGQWVYPLEIEHVLIQHPAIKECLVIGENDEAGLTQLKALIVLEENQSSIEKQNLFSDFKKFLMSKVAPYKHPKEYRIVEALPKTSTGKIKRVNKK